MLARMSLPFFASLAVLAAVAVSAAGCDRQDPAARLAWLESNDAASSAAEQVPMVAFDALDRDQDDSIAPWEAQSDAALAARFQSLDTNRNGKLDRAEYYGGR